MKINQQTNQTIDCQRRAAQIRAEIARLKDELNNIFGLPPSIPVKRANQPELREFENDKYVSSRERY
jgi:hypothetical protein